MVISPSPIVAAKLVWQDLVLGLLSITGALLLVWGSPPHADAARQLLAVLLAAGLGGLALVGVSCWSRFDQTPWWWVVGLALLLRLIAVQASPLLEDDHYRYLWDGFRTATTLDPYRLPPSAFFDDSRLPAMWQDVLSGINNPDIPTLYGPVLQGLFALAHAAAPAKVGAIQGALLLADMVVLGLLALAGVRTRWLLVYAVHPLVLKEAMASAHPDGLVALFLLLALMAWQRGHAAWTGVALGVAVGTKVVALLALPVLLCVPWFAAGVTSNTTRAWRWAWRLSAGFVMTLTLLYTPFVWVGGSDMASLATFGSQWRFNPLLFRAFEWLLPTPMARPMAAMAIVLAVSATLWHWRRAGRAGRITTPPLHTALTLLLLFAPVVNPWYWLWSLAPALMAGSSVVIVMGVVAVLSYLNTSVLAEAGWMAAAGATPYQVSGALALLQLLVLLAATRLPGFGKVLTPQ